MPQSLLIWCILVLVLFLNHLPSSQATCSTEFNTRLLQRTNEIRALHGSPPLTIDPDLTTSAQSWAEEQHQFGQQTHSNSNEYGENIFYSSANDYTETALADACIKTWYDNELPLYHWWGEEPDFTNFKSWTHLTQLIWKASNATGFGCSAVGWEIYIVAHYRPKGNIVSQFGENVKCCGDHC